MRNNLVLARGAQNSYWNRTGQDRTGQDRTGQKNQPVSLTRISIQEQGAHSKGLFLSKSRNSSSGLKELCLFKRKQQKKQNLKLDEEPTLGPPVWGKWGGGDDATELLGIYANDGFEY